MLHNWGCTMVLTDAGRGGCYKSVLSIYLKITPIVAKLYENSRNRSLRICQISNNTPLIVTVCGRLSADYCRSPQRSIRYLATDVELY
ncbi:hypothetical protein [Chamaesiphon sp.]|uniref:hypothetical protein n=1 Tax=Chamaesiphon sp. TaxID=2814140 RepID=UPI0035933E1F